MFFIPKKQIVRKKTSLKKCEKTKYHNKVTAPESDDTRKSWHQKVTAPESDIKK